MAACWYLYLLECCGANGSTSLYTGITTDLERRFAEHVAGIGARYTRAHPPIRLLASRPYSDRASASRAEAALKKRPSRVKREFFAEDVR